MQMKFFFFFTSIISLNNEHSIFVDDGWTWSALIPQQIERVLRRVNEACFRSLVGCVSLQLSFRAVMTNSNNNDTLLLSPWLLDTRDKMFTTHFLKMFTVWTVHLVSACHAHPCSDNYSLISHLIYTLQVFLSTLP